MLGQRPSPLEQTARATGAVARVKGETLVQLLRTQPVEFVVEAPRYLLRTSTAGRGIIQLGWQYLAVSRGIVFFASSRERIEVPASHRKIEAQDVFVSFLGADRIAW
jgi:hypothetical protein